MIYPYLPDLHHFYKTPLGHRCQYFLGKHIKKFSQKAQYAGIIGYGMPYLSYLPEVIFSTLPAQQGINYYHQSICLSHLDALPLKDNSLDFLLIIHCFEFYDHPLFFLEEIKRILKEQGTLVMIVPYFLNYWLKKTTNPFSLGTHYSPFKMQKFFRELDFTIETVKGALYFPCLSAASPLGFLENLENFGQKFLPFLQNLTIYKVTKKVPGIIFPPQIPFKVLQDY